MRHAVNAWHGSRNLWRNFWHFSGQWDHRENDPEDAFREDVHASL